ncbi:MAG: hypothetical protein HY275_03535 [Gemmatimonadetes bacterium]|nr:hypothetical protein [Gemmatimonadota bacterium]
MTRHARQRERRRESWRMLRLAQRRESARCLPRIVADPETLGRDLLRALHATPSRVVHLRVDHVGRIVLGEPAAGDVVYAIGGERRA